MTSIQHHVITQSHSSSNHLDNHLDALLDDLQTSVSRPGTAMALAHNGPLMNGSAFGGQVTLPPGATGYREVTTTVTRENNGVPTTSRDYQIEYLNPANSVTILDERSSSPAMDILKSGDLSGHQVKSFKTEMYDYKFSKTSTDRKVTGYEAPQIGGTEIKATAIDPRSYYPDEPQQQESSHVSRTENYKGETKVSKNLNELDMLLKELNSSPSGGVGEPTAASRREHVQNIEVERSTGRYNESPSTMPKRSASATRETTYTERTETRSNRAQSPAIPSGTPKAPARTINVQREYNTMESRSHASRRDSPSTPTLRRRTPSPSPGEFRPTNFSNYPISPKDLTPTRTVTTKTYNYSTTGRRTPTPTTFADEPQPYRSPSPVSFPQKRSPSPVRKTLNRSDSGRSVSYQVSPPMTENPTVITYKYSSHSREQSRYPGGGHDARIQDETVTRPFPTSTPVPAGEQSPPKKLDELMASFQDCRSRGGNEYAQGSNEFRHHVEYARESERHGGDLQRSPSFERNLRPSNVKVSQMYSAQQQQQQEQEYHNQYQHREQYQQSQYQQSNSQRREEYHSGERPDQYQQQREFQQREYQQREQPGGGYSREYQRREEYHSERPEHYQQQQYQQFHQSQSGYQQEHKEQYQQSHGHQYQYQQHQQYQQNSSQIPVNESMSSSHATRATSASRSVAGPPVYYPPGVELFTKKEEAMLMEQSGGKSKGKSKSKSEKSEKGKDGKGKSGVPVCLPVCCALPCSIM